MRLPLHILELNPIENVWHYLKSHFGSNRSYKGAEDLERAALTAWKAAVLDASLMKTVCPAPHAARATSNWNAYYNSLRRLTVRWIPISRSS